MRSIYIVIWWVQINTGSYFKNSFLFHLTITAAKHSQFPRTLEEEKRCRGTQPGGSSKENQTDGEPDQLHSGTQTGDKTKPGILVHVDHN